MQVPEEISVKESVSPVPTVLSDSFTTMTETAGQIPQAPDRTGHAYLTGPISEVPVRTGTCIYACISAAMPVLPSSVSGEACEKGGKAVQPINSFIHTPAGGQKPNFARFPLKTVSDKNGSTILSKIYILKLERWLHG